MARNIEKIKFNALDTSTNEYIEYNEWLKDEGFIHNNESISKFLEEHFGCAILQYVEFNDKNNNEIYEDNILKIIYNGVENIATVESFKGTYCLDFSKGNIVDLNLEKEQRYLPLSYVYDSVSSDFEIISNSSVN